MRPTRGLRRRRWSGAAILAAALLAFLPPAARAAATRDTAARVVTVAAARGLPVTGLRVVGAGTLASPLKAGLALAIPPLALGQRPLLFPRTLDEDLARARGFLARRGFPYARVTPEVRLNASGRDVSLVLSVTLGPAVILDRLDLAGFPPDLGADPAAAAGLAAGGVLTDPAVERAAAVLADLLRASGYADATVSARVSRLDSTRAALALAAVPGRRYRLGTLRVTGVSPDLEPLVRETASLPVGEIYSPVHLQRARDHLRLLDLFLQVRLRPAPARGDTLDMVADLRLRPAQSLEAGLGLWTDDLLRAQARWQHRNLLRRGRGVELSGAFSRYRTEGAAAAWWPALLGPRTRLETRVRGDEQNEDSYRLDEIEALVGLRWRPTLNNVLRVGIAVSRVDVHVRTPEAEAFLEQGGRLTVLAVDWNRDATDDRLFPRRGTRNWVHLEWGPHGGLSDAHFVLAQAQTAVFHALPGGPVAALRLLGGAATPTRGSEDLLPNRRFFSGGSASMRGYRRHRLGPRDDDGAPLGGESVVEMSVEMRFRLVWRLRGVLFWDAGQVWQNWEDTDLNDLAAAIGPGLTVDTPVGPLRADLGLRLDPADDGEPDMVFHLSVGQAF
ncbi:MAG: BamA/TamA family outer membrane protein [Candidatus Krumholzibacteriota bacterium]|nr:BamA/TamA family outer membrane protein [Candidatus Krumholzibacteriota bacterium]